MPLVGGAPLEARTAISLYPPSAPRPARRVAIWTDGSAYQNPGPGGYAALIVAADGVTLCDAVAGFHPFTTNIRMELTAVIAALRQAPLGAVLSVYTDCLSVAKGLAGRTRRHAHRDLWDCYEAVRAGRTVQSRWIPARAALPWHRQADALARRMTAEGYHGGHCAPIELRLGSDPARWRDGAGSARLIAAV